MEALGDGTGVRRKGRRDSGEIGVARHGRGAQTALGRFSGRCSGFAPRSAPGTRGPRCVGRASSREIPGFTSASGEHGTRPSIHRAADLSSPRIRGIGTQSYRGREVADGRSGFPSSVGSISRKQPRLERAGGRAATEGQYAWLRLLDPSKEIKKPVNARRSAPTGWFRIKPNAQSISPAPAAAPLKLIRYK